MALGGLIGAGIGGSIGILGGIFSTRDSQKAMLESYKRQMKTLITNYNYNQNALTQEERYTLDQAKSELFNLTLNGIQNNAQVEAALGETGTEGRTSGQISRAISGQTERRRTGVIDNYYQNVHQIRNQKDALYIQTKSTIEQAEENFNNAQGSAGDNLLGILGSGISGATQGFMLGTGISGGIDALKNIPTGVGIVGGASAFMGGLNQSYSKYNNMFQSMNTVLNMTNNMFTKKRSTGYNWVY